MAAKPEEQVRQALVRWLLDEAKIPPRLISVEYSLSALDPTSRKRADIVVWKPGGTLRQAQGEQHGGLVPWLLGECKAPGILLDDKVADQVRRYAETIHAAFVLVSNGRTTRFFKLAKGKYGEVAGLPLFTSAVNA